MTKDEMKNRISLALKDPILQQGFEIICKENATLKEDYECLEDAHNVLNELYEKLEKENAELKGLKDVATLIRANNDTVVTLMQLNNKLVSKSQQLTKAKELLKRFIELENCTLDYDDIKEAEQFLSEVEK